MCVSKFILISIIFSFSYAFADSPKESDKSIVDYFGIIKAEGNKIVDKNNNPVALHGMSLFWSQWGGKYYNKECVKWLKNDWKCTVVRAAIGVEMDGYLENPDEELKKAMDVIDACIEEGIYVIVDWHDHKAENHLDSAKEFFKIIAEKYGDKPNIIYEIYNEPLKVSWSKVIKPYSEEVIKVIREYDSDNLIVVGNSTWSQDVDSASFDPIEDPNLAYTFHFYTSTHKQYLRDKAIKAFQNGAPLFVTEFGISEASGNGIIEYTETELWLNFIDKNALSTCNWSVMDKEETSAALKPGADPEGGWGEEDLTESGKFIRARLREINRETFNKITEADN